MFLAVLQKDNSVTIYQRNLQVLAYITRNYGRSYRVERIFVTAEVPTEITFYLEMLKPL